MSLRMENITFGYHLDQPVLSNVTLDVQSGKVTALFGPNGCGKSTLLRCLNGSLRPEGGHISLDGRPMAALTARQVAREVAVVPQETPLDVPFTAGQMVMLGRYARWGTWGQESAEDRQVVAECLQRVRAADLAGRLLSQLSGGERQRVIIARALAQQGRVLLLDEPASHLDISHQLELCHLVRTSAREGQAVLMVCHDILIPPMFADVAVLMKEGRIVAAGGVTDVLAPDRLALAFGAMASITWSEGHTVHAVLQ